MNSKIYISNKVGDVMNYHPAALGLLRERMCLRLFAKSCRIGAIIPILSLTIYHVNEIFQEIIFSMT